MSSSGFLDVVGSDARQRLCLEDQCRVIFARFGDTPLITPICECKTLLDAKGGVPESDVYVLPDALPKFLRFDHTMPLSRYLSDHRLTEGRTVFTRIGPVFRRDTPEPGRLREFVQADFDICGDASVFADAECLYALLDTMTQLAGDIPFVLRLNEVCNIQWLMDTAQVPPPQHGEVSRILDKWFKIDSVDLQRQALLAVVLPAVAEALLLLLEPGRLPLSERLQKIVALVQHHSAIPVVIDPTLVRGLNYYTGIIFELVDKDAWGCTLAAGGRYDRLVQVVSQDRTDIPCVGFSVGISRCLHWLAKTYRLPVEPVLRLDVLVCVMDQKITEYVFEVVTKFRQLGMRCSSKDGQKQAIGYCLKNNIPFCAFVGVREASQGKVQVKRLLDRVQIAESDWNLIQKFIQS